MMKSTNNVLVLVPDRFYSTSFITNTINNIGLNVLDIIYTTDLFKETDNYYTIHYDFNIFIYSLYVDKTPYINKYHKEVYNLYDIYFNFNNNIYEIYNNIILDSINKKSIKFNFISINSTINFKAIELLKHKYRETITKEYNDILKDSFIPSLLSINDIDISIEGIIPITNNNKMIINKSAYNIDKTIPFIEKKAIENHLGLNYKVHSFFIYDITNVSTLYNLNLVQEYHKYNKNNSLMLILLVKDKYQYDTIIEDKEIAKVLKLLQKNIVIVDYASFPSIIGKYVEILLKDYRKHTLKVSISNTKIINYINNSIFYNKCYRIDDDIYYEVNITSYEEETLLEYIV